MKEPILQAVVILKSSTITPDLIETVFGFLAFVPRQEMLDTFIERTHVHWEIIARTTDVAPILDAVLGGFQELGVDVIEEIKNIVKDKRVSSETQTKLLNLGKSLVKIAIRQLEATGSSTINVRKMAEVYGLERK